MSNSAKIRILMAGQAVESHKQKLIYVNQPMRINQ
jgi:hypothetical protein